MFLRQMRYAIPVFSSFLLNSCGSNEVPKPDSQLFQSSNSDSAELPISNANETDQEFALATLVCPNGAEYVPSAKLCRKDSVSTGPFTWEMKQRCRAAGGGKPCENKTWNWEFAKSVRGQSFCPPGATLTPKGLCREGKEVFGPFSSSLIATCEAKKGGSVCRNSLQWNAEFAENIAPSPPVNTSLPWKWIMPVDNGLRSDSCGGGEFKAARGGGRRLHKGLDLLGARGTSLLSPCAGRIERGPYDPSGYGNSVVVVCKVPDLITRGNSTYVSFLYGHMDSVSVRAGQSVGAGQRIGTLGKTGNAQAGCVAPHVHFEAVVANNFTDAVNAVPPSLEESESEPLWTEDPSPLTREGQADRQRAFGSVSSLSQAVQARCLNPYAFRATKGLNFNSNIDPFVLLTCLAGNKPTLTQAGLGSAWIPWSRFYAASRFNVNVGIR
jgi:hypothetical protein